MRANRFRSDPDVYETTLADWTSFVVKTCRKPMIPNRLELEKDGSLLLVCEVENGPPIKCRDRKAVRKLICGCMRRRWNRRRAIALENRAERKRS